MMFTVSPTLTFRPDKLTVNDSTTCWRDLSSAILAIRCACRLLVTNGRGISRLICAPSSTMLDDAVPVPLPAPVAVNSTPTALDEAPMAVKSVSPTNRIL